MARPLSGASAASRNPARASPNARAVLPLVLQAEMSERDEQGMHDAIGEMEQRGFPELQLRNAWTMHQAYHRVLPEWAVRKAAGIRSVAVDDRRGVSAAGLSGDSALRAAMTMRRPSAVSAKSIRTRANRMIRELRKLGYRVCKSDLFSLDIHPNPFQYLGDHPAHFIINHHLFG